MHTVLTLTVQLPMYSMLPNTLLPDTLPYILLLTPLSSINTAIDVYFITIIF